MLDTLAKSVENRLRGYKAGRTRHRRRLDLLQEKETLGFDTAEEQRWMLCKIGFSNKMIKWMCEKLATAGR